MSILDWMLKIGERGFGTYLRYDPLREEKKWTIGWYDGRWCDTDDPERAMESLHDFIEKREDNARTD